MRELQGFRSSTDSIKLIVKETTGTASKVLFFFPKDFELVCAFAHVCAVCVCVYVALMHKHPEEDV